MTVFSGDGTLTFIWIVSLQALIEFFIFLSSKAAGILPFPSVPLLYLLSFRESFAYSVYL